MKIDWKKMAPYIVALLVFIGFAVAYCSPILEGKVLQAGDINNWKGAANEAIEYKAQTGEPTFWTNSMFGGMPTYQIAGSLPSGKMQGIIANATRFGFTGDITAVGIIFAYFCGFFLKALRVLLPIKISTIVFLVRFVPFCKYVTISGIDSKLSFAIMP